jgi:DNA-binding transcriptional LysR family regulator
MPSIDRIGRRLRLNDLHVFLAVVQAGSMGKAAERLSTSQSAVSRTIADLEHAFGVRLLDRSPSGVEPTRYGGELMKCGTTVFDELRQGIKNIEFLTDPTVGEVRIGTTEPLSIGIVAITIERLSRQHPGIAFHVTVSDAHAQHRALEERQIDVVVCRTLSEPPADHLEARSLFEDTFVVAAGAQNRWAQRRKISLSELIDEPWMLPPADSLIGSVAAAVFAASGLPVPRTTVFSHSVHLRNRLLEAGRHLTLFPHAMVQFDSKQIAFRVLPVEIPTPSWRVAAITLKNRTPSPVAQIFIDCASDVAKQRSRSTAGRIQRVTRAPR